MLSPLYPLLTAPAFLYQYFTNFVLERALKERRAYQPPAAPRLLYLAASCLPYHVSGYTNRTHELLRALKEASCDFRILSRPGYPWDRRDSLVLPEGNFSTLDGLRYDHLPPRKTLKQLFLSALRGADLIEDYVRANGITCIHAASNHVNALPGLIAAKRLGLPFQYEMRGLWELSRASRFPAYENSRPFKMGLAMEGLVAANADSIFAISHQLALYASERWGIALERFSLLPNCADTARIAPTPDGQVENDLVGYAGSLVSYEGLDVLLRALAILKDRAKPVRLLLIGDGEARPELEQLVKDLKLSAEVEFAGRVHPDEARRKLNRCALICLPRKPFQVCKIVTPLKLVEAMALARPLLVPDLPVFRDELGEYAKDCVFEPDNSMDLARRIEEKLGSPLELAELGRKLRGHVEKNRQWYQHVGQIMREHAVR